MPNIFFTASLRGDELMPIRPYSVHTAANNLNFGFFSRYTKIEKCTIFAAISVSVLGRVNFMQA